MERSFNCIIGGWHIWSGNNTVLASYEPEKRLLTFRTLDDVVNFLFLNSFKQEARQLNRAMAQEVQS